MLLAVRIRLEVMNVTAGMDILDSIVKQVDTINICFNIFLYVLSIFVPAGYFIWHAKTLL